MPTTLPPPPYTLEQLNAAPLEVAAQMLDGLYEHSPWIAQLALALRPFASLAALQVAMTRVLDAAGREPQLALIRAHPELAGKAMVSNTLTAESTHEQSKAGLTHCTPDEFARIQQLNADYNARFGFPFILAVRGPRGTGLDKQTIIDTFARRLQQPVEAELQECLRNIHRIVEIRLHDKFGVEPTLGHEVWDWHAQLAQFSEAPDALTVTYMTDAHQSCTRWLADLMRDCGLDEVQIDAVGNVVGALPGHRTRCALAADGQPLRHRAQRRALRRALGHLRAADGTARAGAARAALALWRGAGRLQRRRRPTLPGHVFGLGRAGRRV